MYVAGEFYEHSIPDPIRLAYLGAFGREPVGSGDTYITVSKKVAAAVLVSNDELELPVVSAMLENPVTGALRYWYQTIGCLWEQQMWTVAQIREWLVSIGL